MARRAAYTAVEKKNQIREPHVEGNGQTVYRLFQCFNPKCTSVLTVEEDSISEVFEIECPQCGFAHKSGDAIKFYEYDLKETKTNTLIESGDFEISLDDYVSESERYKYCIICNALKPLTAFHKHAVLKSGRQGECVLCKTVYNGIKNQTRITDQHREAAQKRRLYLDITGGGKIDSGAIRARFGHKCFKCSCDLNGPKDGHLDHTLPVSLLWPLTTNNATLLCSRHNGEKSGKWPSEFYSAAELKRLAVLTGIDLSILNGPPQMNPDAITALKDEDFVDGLLQKFAAYIDEIIRLRNRVLTSSGFDFFSVSSSISPDIIEKADEAL